MSSIEKESLAGRREGPKERENEPYRDIQSRMSQRLRRIRPNYILQGGRADRGLVSTAPAQNLRYINKRCPGWDK
ncbi:hypothetical protein MHYP_G00120250 [Metynnis hypsauchen]